ncbi:hypothetical protein EMCRGX_G012223 [Ephydatia muelleri]
MLNRNATRYFRRISGGVNIKAERWIPNGLVQSMITHDFDKGFYSIVTLGEKKIVTKRINGAHLNPSCPHQSTSPSCPPHQSTSPSCPHQSTSTTPASERNSGVHLKLSKCEEDDSERGEIYYAALNEQLYTPHLLRLWRTGACELYYEAEQDNEEFKGENLHLQNDEFAMLSILKI